MLDTAQYFISNIAVASVIASLAWFVGRSGRHSALAHLLWVSVFLKLIIPPIAILAIPVPSVWFPHSTVVHELPSSPSVIALQKSAPEISGAVTIAPQASETRPSQRQRIWLPSWPELILYVWAIGFVVVVGRGLIRFFRLQSLLRNEGMLDHEAGEFVSQLVQRNQQSALLARKAPLVVRIPIRISPMLFGLGRRSVIVCPELLWQLLAEPERQAFLAHETAHFCRRDHWVRWIEWFVSAVYWWFPALIVARQQLEMHEEACCDLWAVQQLQSTPRSYAEALLKAVDFMSVKHPAMPRLASSMQATADLERRLILVMQSNNQQRTTRLQSASALMAIITLAMLHPLLVPSVDVVVRSTNLQRDKRLSIQSDTSNLAAAKKSQNTFQPPLPQQPKGFWNRLPESEWAEFSLSFPSASVVSDVEQGIRIQVAGKPDLLFQRTELTTLVDLPFAQRIAVGSVDGAIRVWDLEAAKAVSLIGRHAGAVISMDYRDAMGIISADEKGTVIRWDLQSGERLAEFESKTSIQAIRIGHSGTQTAILSGSWKNAEPQTLTIVNTVTLQPIASASLHLPTAIMVPTEEDRWLLIDWAGNVYTADTKRLVARIPKLQVSALVFASSQPHGLQQPSQPASAYPIDSTFEDSAPSATEN